MTTSVAATAKIEHALPSLRPIMLPVTGLLLAQFMLVLSGSMIATSLPTLMGELDGPHSHTAWLIGATILANTASIPVWGKLTDRINPKRILILSLLIFILGAVLASFATTTWFMLIARSIQGIAIGGVAATIIIVIAHLVSSRQRGRVNGWVTSSMTLAQIAGPAVGGLIVQTAWLGWRWCFLLLVPASVIALIVIARTLHVVMPKTQRLPLDIAGSILCASGVTAVLIAATALGAGEESELLAIVSGAYGIVALVAFVVVELRVVDPIIPLRRLATRTNTLSALAAFSVGSTFFVGTVFMTQYLQFALGFMPATAGLFLVPMAAATVVTSIQAGRSMSATGRLRPVLIYGMSVLFAGVVLIGFGLAAAPLPVAVTGTLLIGSGLGALAQNIVVAAQNRTPQEHIGSVSSSVMFMYTLGGAAGLVVLGAVLSSWVDPELAAGISHADAYAAAIPRIFQLTALILIPAFACVLALPRIQLRSATTRDSADPAAVAPAI